MSLSELYKNVERLLTKYNLPEQKYKGKSKGRRNTFGIVCHVLKYTRPPFPCSNNTRYPELYQALRDLGDQIVPFTYDAICINQNTVMGPHKDVGNLGSSLLMTLGNHTGGAFVLEGVPQDTLYNPIVFNGDTHTHWAEPFEGTRFSVIYFKIMIPDKFLHLYPNDVNDPNREYSLMDLY
jgi:hypothetical protein